jgi:hypothetical protein
MKKILLIIICSFTLSACQNVPVWKYGMFDGPSGNRPYPPMYKAGWKDGCESGAEASANYFYRSKYKFRQNWQLLGNNVYMSGWENAYEQCRKYVLQHNLDQLHKS